MMNHNYGSEKVLNCNHMFGGNNGWYQQEPNLNSWLDYNYRDTYNYSSQTQNPDYILNFEESHNNAQSQYYQQQNKITEENYDMSVQYNNTENRQVSTNTTTQQAIHDEPDLYIISNDNQRYPGYIHLCTL